MPPRWLVKCLLAVILIGAGDWMWSHFAERAGAVVTASMQTPAR